MDRSLVVFVLVLSLLTGTTTSLMSVYNRQQPLTQPKSTQSSNQTIVDTYGSATLGDGSLIIVTLQKGQSLEVETRYGTLTIPFQEIRRVEFGHHIRPREAEKIASKIKELGSKNFNERDNAQRSLLSYGEEAWYLLQDASKTSDAETALRINKIITQFGHIPIRKTNDVVITQYGPVSGRIRNSIIGVVSVHFGELTLRPCDVRLLLLYDNKDTTVEVDAAKYGIPNGWLDTGLDLMIRQNVEVSASGTVDLWPTQPGQYVSEFEGLPNYKGGALVGKIGESGTTFPIKELSKNLMGHEGRLYLRITESQWNNVMAGGYKLNIKFK